MNDKARVVSRQSAMNNATIEHIEASGLYAALLRREGCEERWVSSVSMEGDSPAAVLERAARHVFDAGMDIVSIEIVGLPMATEDIELVLERIYGPVRWPVTWIGNSGDAAGCGGVQLWAVRGPRVRPVQRDGRTYGVVFEDASAQFCRLGGVTSSDTGLSPAKQAASVLCRMDATLEAASMDFDDTARTWYYNRDILTWYDEFNAVRNEFFEERRVFSSLMPASTGVGAVPSSGADIVGGLIGIKTKGEDVRIAAAPSPLQRSAVEYGSAFSRAVLAAFPDHRRLYVSGTASISQDGVTTFARDVDAQIERTMAVVEAILNASDMDWDAVTRGIAYLKHARDVPRFSEYCVRTGLDRLPLVVMNADICRDDLLFEIEVDAIRVSR